MGHKRLKGNPPFLDQDLGGEVVEDESFWTLEEDESGKFVLHFQFQKAKVAEIWPSAIKGHSELDPMQLQQVHSILFIFNFKQCFLHVRTYQVQEKIMLERFGRENPGFDFSQVVFISLKLSHEPFTRLLSVDKLPIPDLLWVA